MHSVRRPSWWTDGALLEMSARARTDTPSSPYALAVRLHVLMGIPQARTDATVRGWVLGRRSSAQLREASHLLKQQASLEPSGSPKAAKALHNAAVIFEAALRMEATERARAPTPAAASHVALGEGREAVAHAEGGGAGGAAAGEPAASSDAMGDGPQHRLEAMRQRRAALEEQVAALERSLATVHTGPMLA